MIMTIDIFDTISEENDWTRRDEGDDYDEDGCAIFDS